MEERGGQDLGRGLAMRRPIILIVVFALVLSGCEALGGRKEPDAPAELGDFEASLRLEREWSRDLGRGERLLRAGMGPVHLAGVIYAASPDGRLLAIELQTGAERWSVREGPRFSSTPGVGDGLLAVGTLDGEVVVYGLEDGSERWRATVSSEVIAAPAIGDGLVVARVHDGRLFAFSSGDGSRRWIYDRGVPLLSLRGNGAPLLRGGLLFVGYDDGKIVALRAGDGSVLWEHTLSAREGRSEIERLGDVDGALQIVGSDLYAVAYRAQAAAVTLEGGRALWTRELSSASGLALSGRVLYASDHEGVVHALDRTSGAPLWRQEALRFRGLGLPAVGEGFLVVGDFEGYIHALDGEDGRIIGRVRAGRGAIRGAPLIVGDRLVVQDARGRLSAYRIGR